VFDLLARFRVALGFALGALVLWLAEPTGSTIAAGVAIAIIGEGIRTWAAGHLNKSQEVTASGPYRWVAHPLYVGSSIMGAGLAIASGRAIAAAIIAVYLVTTMAAAIRTEEAFLRRRFGDRYEQYRRDGQVNEQRRFSAARAVSNREYRAVIGLAVAVLLLALKATYNGSFWRTAAGP
jgi:protein-S-isoprenylcysteine O-methyltransferase Ste14